MQNNNNKMMNQKMQNKTDQIIKKPQKSLNNIMKDSSHLT
jgi:hypothetical protein